MKKNLITNQVLALRWFASTIKLHSLFEIRYLNLLFILIFVPLLKVLKEKWSKEKEKKYEQHEFTRLLYKNGYLILNNISENLINELEMEFKKKIYAEILPDMPHKKATLSSELISNILKELKVSQLCANYLGSCDPLEEFACVGTFEYRPVLKISSNKYDEATRFHRDLEARRQLKLFIYLNDINENNGCHQYIPKTHRPKKFNELKYMERYENYFDIDSKEPLLNMIGPRGFSFIEDTFGWHRAAPVSSGYRSMIILSIYPLKDFISFQKILKFNDYILVNH